MVLSLSCTDIRMIIFHLWLLKIILAREKVFLFGTDDMILNKYYPEKNKLRNLISIYKVMLGPSISPLNALWLEIKWNYSVQHTIVQIMYVNHVVTVYTLRLTNREWKQRFICTSSSLKCTNCANIWIWMTTVNVGVGDIGVSYYEKFVQLW